jgi:hypothetical protein
LLLADPEEGVQRVGPDIAGYEVAATLLADVRRLTGRLPLMVNLRFDQPPIVPPGLTPGGWVRRPRYDRSGKRGETLGERAARARESDDTNG